MNSKYNLQKIITKGLNSLNSTSTNTNTNNNTFNNIPEEELESLEQPHLVEVGVDFEAFSSRNKDNSLVRPSVLGYRRGSLPNNESITIRSNGIRFNSSPTIITLESGVHHFQQEQQIQFKNSNQIEGDSTSRFSDSPSSYSPSISSKAVPSTTERKSHKPIGSSNSILISTTSPGTLSRRNISPQTSPFDYQPFNNYSISPTTTTDREVKSIFRSSTSVILLKKVWYFIKVKLLFNRGWNRLMRVILLVLLVSLIWYFSLNSEIVQVKRDKLTTKWWEKDAIPVSLLPTPSISPKINYIPQIISTSHSPIQLSKLKSTFTPSSSAFEYTAFIHLSTKSQVDNLITLISLLKSQSIPPTPILILSPKNLKLPSLNDLPSNDHLIFKTYSATISPTLAIIQTSNSIFTPYVLVIDSTSIPNNSIYVETLLKIIGTKEYSNSFLSSTGLYFSSPSSPSSPSSTSSILTCYKSSSTSNSQQIVIPTSPFLLSTIHLSNINKSLNGLRLDLDSIVALSLALSTKEKLVGFGIPIPDSTLSATEEDENCSSNSISTLNKSKQDQLKELFLNSLSSNNISNEDGFIILLLSGKEELQEAYTFACKVSQKHNFKIYLSDFDFTTFASSGSTRFFFEPEFKLNGEKEDKNEIKCYLDIIPLILPLSTSTTTTTTSNSISTIISEELSKLSRVELVIYLKEGERFEEFNQVMRTKNGLFTSTNGSRKKRRKVMENEVGRIVMIELKRDEIGLVDWISALSMEALRNWHTPRIDISVITNNRPTSLNRLLTALQNAHYFNDQVSLTINLEQTTDRLSQQLAQNFEWEHGTISIRHRIVLGGLMPAIVESWYPSDNDTYGVLLEDDVEVSPLFFSWLKFTLLHYRYSSLQMKEESKRLFGISLYQQKNLELKPSGRQPFDAHTLFSTLSSSTNHKFNTPSNSPYLSQIPCSWGAVYFPEIWTEFHLYLSLRLSSTSLSISSPIVPSIRSNRWHKSWKKYFIELIWLRGYLMLYPNYFNFISFSTNHLEMGTHIHVKEMDWKRKAMFEVPLMGRGDNFNYNNNFSLLVGSEGGGGKGITVLNGLPFHKLPNWIELPVLDLWGDIVLSTSTIKSKTLILSPSEILIERGWQSHQSLELNCPKIDLIKELTFDARELLCQSSLSEKSRTGGIKEIVKVEQQEEGIVVLPLEIGVEGREVQELLEEVTSTFSESIVPVSSPKPSSVVPESSVTLQLPLELPPEIIEEIKVDLKGVENQTLVPLTIIEEAAMELKEVLEEVRDPIGITEEEEEEGEEEDTDWIEGEEEEEDDEDEEWTEEEEIVGKKVTRGIQIEEGIIVEELPKREKKRFVMERLKGDEEEGSSSIV